MSNTKISKELINKKICQNNVNNSIKLQGLTGGLTKTCN